MSADSGYNSGQIEVLPQPLEHTSMRDEMVPEDETRHQGLVQRQMWKQVEVVYETGSMCIQEC